MSAAAAEEAAPRAERAALSARIAAALSVLAVFLLSRPYFGIRHDARIYVGRAEADLGRPGMAQSLMFAHDGQSKFSIFGRLFRPLVEHLGSPAAAALATGVGLACWLAAAAFLVSRIRRGAGLWAGVMALAALPGFYVGVLAFAEPFITPRIFAEALACLALGFVLDRRWIAAGALLALATALHPIMTAPAVAVFGLMLAMQDRRWLALAAAGLAAALAAAFAGLPLISRLTTPIDPAWLQMLQQRSAYLFPTLWGEGSWLMLLRQSLTLAIAAGLLHGQPRRLAVAVLGVGAGGVLLTILAPTLLVIQMQPWRGQWTVALLSTALLPFAIARLWKAGGGPRAGAACLAIAWGAADPSWLGPACMLLAAALAFLPQARRLPAIGWKAAWALAGLLLLRSGLIAALAGITHGQAVGFDNLIARILVSEALAILTVALAVLALVRREPMIRLAARPWAAAVGLAAVLAGAAAWDAQDGWTRARDSGEGAAALRAQLPPGEVFWLGGDGRASAWTGRPEWWSVNEGASSVFDRTLAMEWKRRHEILIRAGLTSRKVELMEDLNKPKSVLTTAGLDLTCAAPRGPAAVIAPLYRTSPQVRARASGRWTAPSAARSDPKSAGVYLIFRCAPAASAENGEV